MVDFEWPVRPILYIGALGAILLLRKLQQDQKRNPNRLPYPPGPKPLPIMGNVNDMPKSHDWLTFTDWAKEFGDIVHVHIWGRHFLVLSSLQVTNDLFDKKSSIYSDRPRYTMLNELIGWDWAFAFMQYGTWWRRHRKTFHQYFYPQAAANYRPAQTSEGRKTLKKLLDTPEEFAEHVRQLAASTIMRVVYGIEVINSDDRYVVQAEKANATLAEGGVPRMFLVDTIPILKYVPAWMPGAGFQVKAQRWNKVVLDFVNFPFETVKQQMAKGTAKPSIVADLLDKLKDAENQEEEELIAKNTSAVAYSAGADTTVAAILTFLFTMVLHPDEQKKAQAELDAVIGTDRLPEFSDEESLPYVTAVLKETLRWLPVAPQAIAHCTNDDDEYNGYFIPKGTTVIGNSWAILHNEENYPEPFKFVPERFLKDGRINPKVLDPEVAAFGFGRRVCPGRYMAYNSLFITFASILATFNITQAKDENGNLVEVNREMEGGLISFPHHFKIDIKPRSTKAAALIRQAVDNDTSE